MSGQTLTRTLQAAVDAGAQEIAYVTPTRSWTFREVDDESSRVAHGLLALGLAPGDRVACLTKHTAECVVLTLAACKIGAVCMPVNWRLAPPEIEFIISDGQAVFLMADQAFLPLIARVDLPGIRKTVTTDDAQGPLGFAHWRSAYPERAPGYEARSSSTALQLYSSGTTGLPKGVELSHDNLHALFSSNGHYFDFDRTGILFNALPTFHIAGIGLGLLTIATLGRTVLYPDFDPPRIISGIAEHGITHMFLVPAMIHALLASPDVEAADYSSLRTMAYGASPISEKILVSAIRTFKCAFLQVYGLTETSGSVTFLPPADHDPEGPRAYLLRSAGKPGRNIGVRVVDAAGIDVGEGTVGEIWIHFAGNMNGYWRKPEATAAAFPEGRADGIGWFRTGDAGYLREGYVFIHDRIKDMIVSGGENIYPAEVENALMKHPAVADTAVIGVPDERWGEAVKACVVLRPNVSASGEEIIAFCREQIAHFKCPRSIDFLNSLPRNPSGKLLKFQLRAPYWEGRERQVN